MLDRSQELDAFKTNINLIAYAAACGYTLDRRASSHNSAVMRHPDGDKIVIARTPEGRWIFFSVRDDQDNGTVIDFVQRRKSLSLGEVRKELRPWLGAYHSPALPVPANPFADRPQLVPQRKDFLRVRASYEAMQPITNGHPYLEQERQIPTNVLAHPRFCDRIRTDARGNAVFPHWNLDGLCGFEIKNRGFTGFAPGGEKGLWSSAGMATDDTLVITESAIDALSHFAIRRPLDSRYVSTGGTLNRTQHELLRHAVRTLPRVSDVIIATDNDAGGDKLAQVIRELLAPLGSHFAIREDRPQHRGTDWNDALRARAL